MAEVNQRAQVGDVRHEKAQVMFQVICILVMVWGSRPGVCPGHAKLPAGRDEPNNGVALL